MDYTKVLNKMSLSSLFICNLVIDMVASETFAI